MEKETGREVDGHGEIVCSKMLDAKIIFSLVGTHGSR